MSVGAAFLLLGFNFLLSYRVFHVTFKDHLLSVRVRSIVVLDRFDHFSVFRSTWLLKSCYYFLCHGLLNFFVYGILSHDRVVFLQLNSIRSVFSVLGGNVPACAWQTTVFVLCALKNYLDSISFLRHFILSFPKRSANVENFKLLMKHSEN